MTNPREARRRQLGMELLQSVEGIIYGDRNRDYGDAADDFQRTAEMSGAYNGVDKTPTDHAADMILVKLSRIKHSPAHRDSWLDIIGYAVLGYSIAAEAAEHEEMEKLRSSYLLKVPLLRNFVRLYRNRFAKVPTTNS